MVCDERFGVGFACPWFEVGDGVVDWFSAEATVAAYFADVFPHAVLLCCVATDHDQVLRMSIRAVGHEWMVTALAWRVMVTLLPCTVTCSPMFMAGMRWPSKVIPCWLMTTDPLMRPTGVS